MKIQLKQFGITLSSRQAGEEAYNSIIPIISEIDKKEAVEIDFDGISSFSPSWGDEFLTPLFRQLGEKLILLKSDNLSVNATVELLEDISGLKFNQK